MINYMAVNKIDNQGDRILLYGQDESYHVIANTDVDVSIGDRIEFTSISIIISTTLDYSREFIPAFLMRSQHLRFFLLLPAINLCLSIL